MAMIGKLRRRRFGEILVGDGLITHEQLDEALQIQRQSGDALGAILLDLGYIVETDIVKALSIQYQLPCLRPSCYEINRKLLEPFDPVFLHRHLILPIDKMGNLMLLLLQDIPTKDVLKEVQAKSKCDLAIYLGTSTDIKKALMELVPISRQEEEKIRKQRLAARTTHDEQRAAIAQGQSSSIDLSSENILSSLDAAWESIFVESDDTDKK